MRYACLIPARGTSKRFPRKNIAPLKGKPVLGYTVEAAKASGLFPEVWVSTDDAEIADVARQFGASVHDRAASLAGDAARLVDVCLDFTEWLAQRGTPADVLCLILPTAALMRPEDLRGGAAMLDERKADFVMAVTTFLEAPFWALHEVDGYLRPFFGKDYLVASQQLPKVWVDSGYFYFMRVDALRRERALYGERLVGYPIPRERSVDIDEPAHLVIAEALMDAQACARPGPGHWLAGGAEAGR
ncbi:MAG: acylneuraminate cytidylyltransferase family protein [Candidatus Omnitrophica bacterium]|nr:acylneuraminate cytidylyltransferase family protein [Candidatus Omnitrophota bacterium]